MAAQASRAEPRRPRRPGPLQRGDRSQPRRARGDLLALGITAAGALPGSSQPRAADVGGVDPYVGAGADASQHARLAGGEGGAANPEELRAAAPDLRRPLRFHQGAARRAPRDRPRPRRHRRALQTSARRLRARRSGTKGPPHVRRRPERQLGDDADPRWRRRPARQRRALRVARLGRDDRGRRPRAGRSGGDRARRRHAIDVETLRTIFDPVARVESENATYAGLGLGLFIVRKVVDAHGGRVGVEASAGGGTTFTMVLPRRA